MIIYLAQPYTEYPELNYKKALSLTAAALGEGVTVFSPVLHCHNLGHISPCKNFNHEVWMLHCLNWLDACDGAIFVQLEGHKNSVGMKIERLHCKEKKIPYYETIEGGFIKYLKALKAYNLAVNGKVPAHMCFLDKETIYQT